MGQFLEDRATLKPQSRDYWESMQEETVCLTLGKMPEYEMAVVSGSCLQMTLTDIFCPSQALFDSYSFLWKGHDITGLTI